LWYGCKTVIRIHHFIHRSMINVGFVVIILLNPLYTVFKLFAVNNNIEIPSSIRSKLPKNDVFWNTW
jgi:5,10-methylenetetrahydrofolate reductase